MIWMEKDKRIDYDNGEMDLLSGGAAGSSSPPRSLPISSAGLNYIQHPVSKFDTLAGVAIKYGVEVLINLTCSIPSLTIRFLSRLVIGNRSN